MSENNIIISYGTDYKNMSKDICKKANLKQKIGNVNKKIGLKPNLVNATKANQGATTHPEIVEGIILYLQENGFYNISIIEGSWIGDKTTLALKECGFKELVEKYNINFIDTQKDSYQSYDCMGVNLNICDSALNVDFMINIPVMKGHCQTTITCALKNNKGLIPNSEKRRFHTMGLHKPIAHLNTKVRNDFIMVDGICGDLDFEEGGNPVQMNRIIGCFDPVLCDTYICSLLGYSVDEVLYIKLAEYLGVGSTNIREANIIELNSGENTKSQIHFTRKIKMIAEKIDAKDACSACYGSLIHALDRLGRGYFDSSQKICIGQGFKGKTGKIGVGNCTCDFKNSIKGCPPKTIDIIEFLRKV